MGQVLATPYNVVYTRKYICMQALWGESGIRDLPYQRFQLLILTSQQRLPLKQTPRDLNAERPHIVSSIFAFIALVNHQFRGGAKVNHLYANHRAHHLAIILYQTLNRPKSIINRMKKSLSVITCLFQYCLHHLIA